ncbi:MAG: ABC transporter substrate-binding protein [Bacteroidetes bacterium MedPE-SWsnd-G2]|nr:MAG: ABC transporter substrate-binding protein [Bacteroidetes bacterium MedPE-SWsnd-G2]
MKITREVKTAILVISGILLFIYLFNYLKGENLLTSSRTFYALYDNVGGLTPSTPVTISGLNVGRVHKIYFSEKHPGKLEVNIQISNPIEFSENSQVQLFQTSIIGGKGIEIIPANDGAPIAQNGAYLSSESKVGITDALVQKLNPVQAKIEATLTQVELLAKNINETFDDQTKANLKSSVANLNETIVAFKQTSYAINDWLSDNKGKLNNSLDNMEGVTSNMEQITDSIAQANLKETLHNLEGSIASFNSILKGLENGEGTMGKLLKDDGLYVNIEGATKQLEALFEDMKLNPKRYVHFSLFGRKVKIKDAEGNEVEIDN